MSLYFEVITDREVLLFKSLSAADVEQWMRGEYHLNRPGYALHCLNPVDVSDCLGGRVPLIDLACFSDACPAGTGNDTEQDLLQLVDEFLATSSVDFPSSILFYPAELLSRNRA